MNTYDIYGWYSADKFPDRVATAPDNTSETTTTGDMRANWTGYAWVDMPYQAPPPAPESAPLPALEYTSLEYLDLFTEAEQLAVVSATMVNAQVKLWYDKMLAASSITIADPRTAEGLDALVSAGLLTAERKNVIVATMSS